MYEPVGTIDHFVSWNADGRSIGGFPVEGWLEAVYSEPYVVLDRVGRVWVSVPLRHEIRAYDRQGQLLRTVRPGENRPGLFETPTGVAYDSGTNEVVVADLAGRIVRVNAGP